MDCPIEKFNTLWKSYRSSTTLTHQGAMSVSTINAAGFPTSRFVDLKEASDKGFTFCTYLNSPKGIDIQANDKVGLTFWWDELSYQIRILGRAKKLDKEQAILFWNARSQEAKITTLCSKQSEPLSSEDDLHASFNRLKDELANETISLPENWGGFVVSPCSIEFLKFKVSRLHRREIYLKTEEGWNKSLLQP